jgi:hypothetical protein
MRVPAKNPGQGGCVEAPVVAAVDREQAARPGAAPTFAEVFAAQAAYVLGLLGRLGVAAADLEDVAQELFIVVHQKLPGFEQTLAQRVPSAGYPGY